MEVRMKSQGFTHPKQLMLILNHRQIFAWTVVMILYMFWYKIMEVRMKSREFTNQKKIN